MTTGSTCKRANRWTDRRPASTSPSARLTGVRSCTRRYTHSVDATSASSSAKRASLAMAMSRCSAPILAEYKAVGIWHADPRTYVRQGVEHALVIRLRWSVRWPRAVVEYATDRLYHLCY